MIRQSDLLIKSTIELILQDMRDNLYLLDDVFSDLLNDPYLAPIYSKDVQNAKEWLKNNDIKVLLRLRNDPQEFPCVTISLGSDNEDESKSTLSDQTVDSQEFESATIGKSIGYIIKPFTPTGYDQAAGVLEAPTDTDLSLVNPGMVLVDSETGTGYEILGLGGTNGIQIQPNTSLSLSKAGVLPKNMKWKARIEGSYFKQQFTIGCHVSDDPATLIWLHSIILYGLLRHRELFTSRCFNLSSVSSSDLDRNRSFAPTTDNVFSRFITLQAHTQHTWLKSPKRYIEATQPSFDYQANTDTDNLAADPTGDGWDTTPVQQSSSRRVFRRG